MHEAGIAVVLDVVFNHTAEGDHRGPTQSLRGLDGPASYLMTPDGGYRNLTATGNTVNANHPRTRALILDSLRHWATEYRVDGFRFDMACILARGQDGELLDNPPLLEDIAHDPVLADRLLVAEATDATGLDLTGGFPSYGRWSEWNARYRDDIRRFLLGRPGSAAFAPRLLGSPDLYGGRTATASVNYITCHDGMTLADLTSYDERHNHANGEGGADGIPDEDSWNCGHEGPTGDPAVLLTRDRQRRTALALLFLSQGCRCCSPVTSSAAPSRATTTPTARTTRSAGWTGRAPVPTRTSSASPGGASPSGARTRSSGASGTPTASRPRAGSCRR
ncbi:hypothetical protein ACFQ3Z_03560 [Streptomyces nogalater]